MAADTATKRLSAMNIGSPWRQTLPIPSAAVGAGERSMLLYLYALSAGAVVIVDPRYIIRGLDEPFAYVAGFDGTAYVDGLDEATAYTYGLDDPTPRVRGLDAPSEYLEGLI